MNVAGNEVDKSAGLSTDALAQGLNIKPQTLRASLSRNGSYFGVRPERLPNDRLIWPGDSIERIRLVAPKPRKRPERKPQVQQGGA